jgi:thiol:disulfide interchange protein/DsbC/DsbD-like thiol-disulfide interchange protein
MGSSTATRRRRLSALAFLFFGARAALGADLPPAEATTPQVRVRLLAASDAVHPGEPILLGIEQKLQPHWHTYWINPGDTGMPTRVDWTLPAGANAGPLQWPVPARFRTGPVTSYGYENRVTLLARVTVPADAKAGGTFPVHARVSWLVCKDVCIPQHAELGLALPVQAIGVPSSPGSLGAIGATGALPLDAPGTVRAVTDGRGVVLTLDGPAFHGEGLEDIRFFNEARGSIAPGAAQAPDIVNGRIVLRLRAGDAALAPGQRLAGVLALRTRTPDGETPRVATPGVATPGVATRGYRIDALLAASAAPIALPPADMPDAPEAAGAAVAPDAGGSLPALLPALGLALLGGLVLNLMPCVFPILSIKALSLLKHARDDARTTRLHGVAYTLGVLASFALLGIVLVVLKAAGERVGWGFQFQSPVFVLATSWLMFAVGLNLSGLFDVGAALSGVGASLADRRGYAGSFFTGVLATVVATPCTAPFMGGAVAFALAQPPAVLLAVLLSMGTGLALPFLALSTWPVLQRRLPRPGAWMERLRQALAFPMYGAAVWLAWVLVRQAGPDAVPIALGGMVAIAFAAWLYRNTARARPASRRAAGAVAALVLAAALGAGWIGVGAQTGTHASAQAAAETGASWSPYTAERLDALRADGQPVFLNLTAAWCITCLVNERVALRDAAVTTAFRTAGIHALKGDWTNQDARISALLAQFGRSGVPLYVFYPAGRAARPTVLPQLLSPGAVLEAIRPRVVQARQ